MVIEYTEEFGIYIQLIELIRNSKKLLHYFWLSDIAIQTD